MSYASLFRLDLRRLILFLAIVATLVMLVNGFYASYRVQKQILIDNELETNQAYAAKLAADTNGFLQASQQQLAYSARLLAPQFGRQQALRIEADRLLTQTNSFNEVLIVDADGYLKGAAPGHELGQQLNTPEVIQARYAQYPLVSLSARSEGPDLRVTLSTPVTNSAGVHLGSLIGVIRLDQQNILHQILGSHHYHNGTYLYVIDQHRRLLYHPDSARIGTVVGRNLAVDAVLRGQTGSRQVINSQDVDMLAGYAPVNTTGWGVIAQRTTAATLLPLADQMGSVLRTTLPVTLFTLICIWWLAHHISRPLSQLARGANKMDAHDSARDIEGIHSWYFEADEIKGAMLVGLNLLQQQIGRLHHDVQTDPMTGLYNRRGMALLVTEWCRQQRPFSLVLLDLDHFKTVNDTHGHDAGDDVLRHFAQLMQACSRDGDVPCRLGGEEFLMLLPDVLPDDAVKVAERLRLRVAGADIPGVGRISCSVGIASWPLHGEDFDAVFKAADKALYRAKQNGRNRTELARA